VEHKSTSPEVGNTPPVHNKSTDSEDKTVHENKDSSDELVLQQPFCLTRP